MILIMQNYSNYMLLPIEYKRKKCSTYATLLTKLNKKLTKKTK